MEEINCMRCGRSFQKRDLEPVGDGYLCQDCWKDYLQWLDNGGLEIVLEKLSQITDCINNIS